MGMIRLAVVFLVIVFFIWWKKPLYMAMGSAILLSLFLYGLSPLEALGVLFRQTIASETIDVLLSFYFITLLQMMLESRGHLQEAKDAFNALLRNRHLNTIISPATIGLLPSAAVMTICADMVDQSCGSYLDAREKTFVACYYRHIPEMFLPTYPVVLMALALSGQNAGVYILSMIPLVVLACVVVNLYYLRRIPRDMPPLSQPVDRKREICSVVKSLWTLIAVLLIIIVFNLSASIAAPIVIAVNFFTDRFQAGELPQLLKKAFEPDLLGCMYFIMLFKGLLSHTGALNALPEFFATFPIPLSLSFCLLFFAGTVIAGSQAMVALCLPMMVAAFPQGGLPMLAMVMGVAWAAMELSPTHVCAFVSADFYHTSFSDIVAKGVVPVLIFAALCYGYGQLLMLLF